VEDPGSYEAIGGQVFVLVPRGFPVSIIPLPPHNFLDLIVRLPSLDRSNEWTTSVFLILLIAQAPSWLWQ
jgi:hypothetical protein